ncbi:MAG: penicillin-binding protein 1C, partial [Bacteroidales bacterium]|nr:penicillin-binding protein 1C [Bacteroidales bacterium]
CELAKDEPLPDKPLPMPDKAYHLLERLRAEGGDKAYTCTVDEALQERVNNIARNHFEIYHQNLVDNMGILVLDVHSGQVKAYYGNTHGLAGGLRGAEVDMVPAPRSSGSTLKPLLYAAMLQKGLILPGTLIKDTPYNYNNFSPHNFSRSFDGAVPANEVIERSLNVPSVRMLERYGVPEFLELLQAMGFSTINKDADHYGLSLILGGAEITLQTLAECYRSMAVKLLDEGCEDLPLGRGAIWLTFEALSRAGRPEEESSWMEFSSGRKIAWKTGTSWGNRDAWSVGVNPDYVVAVWVGNSDGEGRSQMTGVGYASPVMFDVFNALPHSRWFSMPLDDMVPIAVCHQSGLPASRICPDRDTVWVPDIKVRPDECKYHRIVHLDAERQYLVNSSCYPVEKMVEEVRFVLPPAMEWYYIKNHIDYRPLPPKHPDFDSGTDGGNPIEIIYPQQGVTVVLTRGLDGKDQGVVVRAAHTDPSAVLYWHLDDKYVARTVGEHDLMLRPEPGAHLLVAMDSNGASRSVYFIVK